MARWAARVSAAGLVCASLVPAVGSTPASAVARAPASRAPVPPPESLRLGAITLRQCAASPLAYCGTLAVPLDYATAGSPAIRVGFRWLPATVTTQQRSATVLAVEGGPGFSSTGTQPGYRAMMGTLVRTRNLLMVNLRGTGNSTPVNCPALEHYGHPQHSYGHAFDLAVAACGRQLNHTWHYRHGGWVHASDLFNTAYSARDVLGVLRALRLGRVDLYGDSYGSWFAQAFAARYPSRLRSLTLDSTYQVLGLDPWYTTSIVTARQAFAQACARSAACTAATGGHGAWARMGALDARLARAPVSGVTVSPSGTLTRLTVTPETLVNLVGNAGFDPMVYQDTDAAARALLRGNDPVPLLRVAELSVEFDDVLPPLPEYSDGLYFAVACTDYTQLFRRTATPARRASQYRAALRREPPRTFAPFSVAQWTRMDAYTEAISACLDWPVPTRLVRPITRRPPLVPSSLPVLILSGTFDSLTPWLHGAALVARQMGRSARVVRVANLTHVTLQDSNDGCPAVIYQRFVRHPTGLARLDTSCARRVTPVHTVGTYPLRLAGAAPATATHGNTAGPQALWAASVALASAGDETSRWPLLYGNRDRGLRGGQVRFRGGTLLRISLHDVRWVTDAVINGTVRWDQVTDQVIARLSVRTAHSAPVRLTAHWQPFGPPGRLAVITGNQGKRHLAAVCPAP